MSNTSVVAPSAGVAFVAGLALVAGLAAWLAEESLQEREAVGKSRRRRSEEVLGGTRKAAATSSKQQSNITAVDLRLSNAESLAAAAEVLGYRRESLSGSGKLLKSDQILLRRGAGERVAIGRRSNGQLVVHTAGSEQSVRSLVRQHSIDRVFDHLRSSGMQVRKAELANGEVQILGHEIKGPSGRGKAVVKTQVRNDGTLLVDVDQVVGDRCESLVGGIATAVGGDVCGMRKKPAYFELPGEATTVEVKV